MEICGADSWLQIFFFWNRILGGIVGFALRLYLWKTSDGHISIGMSSCLPLQKKPLTLEL
jgi:hypothetical protein